MTSKYLNLLNENQRKELEEKLYSKQSGKCYICDDSIELGVHQVDIDHIIPSNLDGKDSENNFAITHASCNREKQDTNLEVARTIHLFKKIEKETIDTSKVLPDLSNILKKFGGSKSDFKFKIDGNKIKYSFSDNGDDTLYESLIYHDKISGLKSFFIEVPLEYLYHDELGLNPRKLSDNVIKLIKEFYNKRPQLHIGVGRLNTTKDSKLFIFDGQHKAAAQILLGTKKLLLRVFIDPEVELLAITNERAGTVLRQIAFDKSVQRQMGSTILSWKIERLQTDKNLSSDDYSFSEAELVSHFRGEGREIKKFVLDFIRRKIIEDPENKIVKLMNIIQEEILSGFDFNIGSFKIEERIRKIKEGKNNEVIPDAHLKAYRLWNNIRNLLKNLNDLPIWTDRDRTHLFSKKEYGYWQEILRTGKSPDNIQALNEGVNIVEMINR